MDQIYVPAPENPGAFNARLWRLGGTAPNGQQRLRVVWGMDATEFRGGNPQAIKYPSFNKKERGMPFWIAEQWHPPTMFDEVSWAADRYEDGVDLMGPFPSQGFYGMLFPVTNPDGSYAPLNTALYERLSLMKAARDNATVEQSLLLKQQRQKIAMEKQAEEARRSEKHDNMNWYFSKEDYDGKDRKYSFAEKPVSNLILPPEEKRTPGGLIIP